MHAAGACGTYCLCWSCRTTHTPGLCTRARARAQVTFPFAVVEAGISLSHVVAAPLAAMCLSMDGLGGLAGWRWLFVLEGLPTLFLAGAPTAPLPSSSLPPPTLAGWQSLERQ